MPQDIKVSSLHFSILNFPRRAHGEKSAETAAKTRGELSLKCGRGRLESSFESSFVFLYSAFSSELVKRYYSNPSFYHFDIALKRWLELEELRAMIV